MNNVQEVKQLINVVPTETKNLNNIPPVLKSHKNWILYNLEEKTDSKGKSKQTKIPYNALTGWYASSTNYSTLTTFDSALEIFEEKSMCYKGLGYVFSKDNEIVGIDIDNCVVDGIPNAFAQEIIDRLDSYTEYSQSGKGIHIIVFGSIPKAVKQEIEMYDNSRFFVMTGDICRKNKNIYERQEALEYLYGKYQKHEEDIKIDNRFDDTTCNLSDIEIIEKASNAKNGELFKSLFYNGDLSNYNNDHSSADAGLMALLVFWTQNYNQLDSIFRQSALVRAKWLDRLYYRDYVINFALSNVRDTYNSSKTNCRWDIGKKDIDRDMDTTEDVQKASEQSSLEDEDGPEFEIVFKGERGLAEMLTELNTEKLLYDIQEEEWYYFDKHYWKKDTGTSKCLASLQQIEEMIEQKVIKHRIALQELKKDKDNCDDTKEAIKELKENMKSLEKVLSKVRNITSMKNVIALAGRIDKYLGKTDIKWDSDPYSIGVENGILDLRKGELIKDSTQCYIKTVGNVSYNPDATCVNFKKFINDIFSDDTEIIVYVQKLLGYSLMGMSKQAIFPILYGPKGRNGKSTLIKVLNTIFGEYVNTANKSLIVKGSFQENANSATPDIADLEGKRLVFISELDENETFNTARIKNLSGDDNIKARGLFSNNKTFRPTHTMILSTNYLPKVNGSDDAFWHRVKIIPLLRTFIDNPDPDKENEYLADINIDEKLLAEKEGILNWILEGIQMYLADNTFSTTTNMEKAAAEYRESQNIYERFINNCFTDEKVEKINGIKGKDMFAMFRYWCSEQNEENFDSRTKFGKEIKKYVQSKRTKKWVVYLISTTDEFQKAYDESKKAYTFYSDMHEE